MFRKESIFSSKGPMLKNEFGVEVGGIGGLDGGVKYWGGFLYPPNPSQQNHFMHPIPTPKKEGKGTQQTSPPFFRNHSPNPPYKKCTCTCSLLDHSLSLSLSLFFLHLPSSPSFFSFLIYLTFDINITQLHLHLHLHFSFFFSLPSTPLFFFFFLSFSLSLSLILCFSLWVLSLDCLPQSMDWGWLFKFCSWSTPP